VSVEYDGRWRLLQHVDVNVDHLEKDQVRWWSIDELDAVIVGQGQFGVDRFRPYFLPVLQTALTLVRTRMETIDWAEGGVSQGEDQGDVCTECEPSEPDPSIPTGRDVLPLVTELLP
jgi:hypothetical protein